MAQQYWHERLQKQHWHQKKKMKTFKAHERIEAAATITLVKKETRRGRCTINRNENIGV